MTEGVWRKSSYSGTDGGCVEVEMTTLGWVRDSKHPGGPELRLPDFPALVAEVKNSRINR